ncbi:Ribosomal RNA small subunit methyltransferase E [Porphyromonas macacae]|uniref:Ribosomal RNA small subunit methyltransferase E n=2 Tax=Porphyromonas macacae TaxID=28115 RepID=A0A379DH51_9PORP|nr:16S rRNA (uracil(1498)-N(3))-methyltransferase [Porphyromonas macacae]SUB77671.1 Ribosomal RNA small subunit methyltransferase E [Porphyromonas macacae]
MKSMTDLPLFYAPDIERDFCLPPDESKHCIRVLRMAEGDRIKVTDGQGHFFESVITEASTNKCMLKLNGKEKWHKYWTGTITIAVSPTKNADRIEWLAEKLVELGIDKLVMLKTEHSERKRANKERLERIIVSAMKQSLKAQKPLLEVDVPFDRFAGDCTEPCKLIAHCVDSDELPSRQLPHTIYQGTEDVCILIGPEGDFSLKEVSLATEKGFKGMTMGESRLRTETAALSATQWIHVIQHIKRQ